MINSPVAAVATLPSAARTTWGILLGAVALFILFVWGSASFLLPQERVETTRDSAKSIIAMMQQDGLRLHQLILQAENEVRFFSRIPPVAGIGRALLNNGIDPVDGDTLAQWIERLEQIGEAYVAAQPEVFQLRLIGVADGGRELVRVVQDTADKVTIVGADGLQDKGNSDYFRATMGLPEDGVYFSPIDLNVENDRIELPPRPTLRAAVPVKNERGEVFGVIVVHVLSQQLLDIIGGGHGMPDVQEWVTDAAGHYLSHPQPGKAFAHLLNPPGAAWQEEFSAAPGAAQPAGLPEDADAAVLRAPDGTDWLVFTRTLRAPEADGTGGVVLHSGIPLQVIAAQAWQRVRGQVMLLWAMGLVVFGLGTLLLLRWERLTRHESALVSAADDPAERRSWYVGAGVAVLALLLGASGWWFVRGQQLADARDQTSFRAELVAKEMTTSLRSAEHAARVLAELRPDTLSSQAEFEQRAAELNGVTPESLVLQWSPQGIVRFSQPLAGNESAIGLDLRADPRVSAMIDHTIQTGHPFWDGPFPLRQGGIGMVYRVPVYRPGAPPSERDFLGLATCLVNLNEISRSTTAGFWDYDFAVSAQSGRAAPTEILPALPVAAAATSTATEASFVLDPADPLAEGAVTFTVTAALKEPLPGGHSMALAGIALLAALLGGLAHVMETRRVGRRRLLQLSTRLERSAQAAKVGFWEYDLATGKVSWSREVLEFRGLTEGEFAGTLDAAVQFTHPEDQERFAATARDSRPDEPYVIEFRIVRPDGQIRWLEARGVLQTDASGQPMRFVGSETDITARKTAEDAERAIQRRMEEQNAALTRLVITTAREGENLHQQFRTITEAAARTLGVSRASIWLYEEGRGLLCCEDLVEMPVGTHSRGQTLAAGTYPSYFAALGKERLIAADDARADLRTREFVDGYLRPLGITSMLDAVVRTQRKFMGVFCCEHTDAPRQWTLDEQRFASSVADVIALSLESADRAAAEAALRESEAKFRDLWESSRDAHVLCFPPDWKFAGGNAAAVALYGARDSAHLSECTPNDLTPEVQPDGMLSSHKSTHYVNLALHEGFASFECTHQRIDGGLIQTEISLSRITIDGVTGLQATIRDISERKAAEEELKRRLEERSTLLDEVHHRVKNNLTVVTSLLSLQQRQTQDAQAIEQLQVSRDRIAAIAMVHEQLYGSERFDRINFKDYLVQLCQSIMDSSGALARGIRMEVTGEDFSLALTEAVPCSLLVNELVSNSLKHAFPGGRAGRVWMDLGVDSDGARWVRVGDDGVGMAQQAKRDGSLGLQLVNRLTSQLRASLEREAAAVGTLYCLRLPKVQSETGHDA